MERKKAKLGECASGLRREMEKCELCGRKGKIRHAGGLFCSKEHVSLFDEKWQDAEMRMKAIETCSRCGKPVGGSKWTMVDCSIRKIGDAFTPHRFCSEKCWEQWGA